MRTPYLDAIGHVDAFEGIGSGTGNRLFDVYHWPLFGETGQNMLGTLVYEVPAKVRKNEKCLHSFRALGQFHGYI